MISITEARRFAKSLLKEARAERVQRAKESNDYPFKERQEKFVAYLDIVIDELSK